MIQKLGISISLAIYDDPLQSTHCSKQVVTMTAVTCQATVLALDCYSKSGLANKRKNEWNIRKNIFHFKHFTLFCCVSSTLARVDVQQSSFKVGGDWYWTVDHLGSLTSQCSRPVDSLLYRQLISTTILTFHSLQNELFRIFLTITNTHM